MKKMITKNCFAIVIIIICLCTLVFYPRIGTEALRFTGQNIVNFLFVLTPVFVCIGLMDIWIDRETMIGIMGEKSGPRGALIAIIFGMITAVPIYALLPVVGVLLKKGCRLSNVLLFLCASEDIRIPLLLFEISSFGWQFTFLRFGMNFTAVVVFSLAVERILSKADKQAIYENVP